MTKAEIAEIEETIRTERDQNRWLHDLIVETDQALVEAVKKAFEVVGFVKIIDVDKERDREGKTRREDLQVHDKSPTLIVDIKGIGGSPLTTMRFKPVNTHQLGCVNGTELMLLVFRSSTISDICRHSIDRTIYLFAMS